MSSVMLSLSLSMFAVAQALTSLIHLFYMDHSHCIGFHVNVYLLLDCVIVHNFYICVMIILICCFYIQHSFYNAAYEASHFICNMLWMFIEYGCHLEEMKDLYICDIFYHSTLQSASIYIYVQIL